MSLESLPLDQAEIVYEKPASGDFLEVPFGSGLGNTLWVKFSDQHGIAEWIGKFDVGTSTVMRVTKAIDPDKFLVVAGGFAYLVDATAKQLLDQFCSDYVTDVAYDAVRDELISGGLCLRIFRNNEEIWKSDRIALEEIHGLALEGRTLRGIAVTGVNGEEDPFEFNLDDRRLIVKPQNRIGLPDWA